jgi:hypothetical protein
MNDLSLGQIRCSYEATEPYGPCTKQAFVHCGQCGKPYCFTHAQLSPSGRFMCSVCASIEALVLLSRCPSCGGNRIYKPRWKGVGRLTIGRYGPHLTTSHFWDFVSRTPQHTYTYYCAACYYHWDPPDADDSATDDEEERE